MIRVAILGAGIGREHMAAYRRLGDLFQVQVVCDLDPARAKMLGAPEISTDAAATIQRDDIDLIDICLPPHLHVPMALAALAAGKDAICEKPIATSLADVDRLERAEEASPGRLFPVFQYRFGPAMAQLRRLIARNLTGRAIVASLETHWSRDSAYYSVPWRGTWAGEEGGAILSHAIHSHDLICQLFAPVVLVSAHLATRANDIETEDCGAISMECAGGALVSSSITLGGAGDQSRLRLVFERLTAESGLAPYAPMATSWTITARDPADQAGIDAAIADLPPTPGGFEGFLSSVATQENTVTLAEARQSIELVTAIYQSARSGKRVTLPVSRQTPLYHGWRP